MKILLISIALLTSSAMAQPASLPYTGASFSYTGILEQKFSIEFKSTSLVHSVEELSSMLAKEYPESWAGIKFTFKETNKTLHTEESEKPLKFKNTELHNILTILGETYRHKVFFDLQRSTITFHAARSPSPEAERIFVVSKEVAAALDLSLESEQKLLDSLAKRDWFGQVKILNKEKGVILAESIPRELKYLEMMIYVATRSNRAPAKSIGSY